MPCLYSLVLVVVYGKYCNTLQIYTSYWCTFKMTVGQCPLANVIVFLSWFDYGDSRKIPIRESKCWRLLHKYDPISLYLINKDQTKQRHDCFMPNWNPIKISVTYFSQYIDNNVGCTGGEVDISHTASVDPPRPRLGWIPPIFSHF